MNALLARFVSDLLCRIGEKGLHDGKDNVGLVADILESNWCDHYDHEIPAPVLIPCQQNDSAFYLPNPVGARGHTVRRRSNTQWHNLSRI